MIMIKKILIIKRKIEDIRKLKMRIYIATLKQRKKYVHLLHLNQPSIKGMNCVLVDFHLQIKGPTHYLQSDFAKIFSTTSN